MSITIPPAHLIALGFEEGDPPVEATTGLPVGFKQRAVLERNPRWHLKLAESMPALLRALARQYGAKLKSGEVPQWHREEPEGVWWLTWNDGQSQAFTPPEHDGWSEVSAAVPALTADMGRLEALATVIEWLVSR